MITSRPSNRLTWLGVGIALITGAILALIGWRFWRERRDITIFVFGAVQAAFGVFVYMMRFSVHG